MGVEGMTDSIDNNNRRLDGRRALEILLLCSLGILVNILLSDMSGKLELPFYLDAIGTIFAASIGGSLPGIIVGLVTNLLKSISDWTIMDAIIKAKPSAAKGQYLKNVSICSTMGPGIRVNAAKL